MNILFASTPATGHINPLLAITRILLAHFRDTRIFTPVLLAVMCGLRRGEITALRWGSVDLVRGQLSVVESTEETANGVRSKETKSGRARTVALPAMVLDELRRACRPG